MARIRAAAGSIGLLALAALALPTPVAAHQLSAVFQSRLPLAVYLAGAAAAVALSFAFVLGRDIRADPPVDDGRRRSLPTLLRLGLRAVGLLGWLWIAVQAFVGGESDAEVARLFAWVYGWVGIALLSAFVGPVWAFLDPFATLHDLGAALLRRAGLAGLVAAPYPERLGRWPAVVGFAAIVWLELVAFGAGSRTLAFVILGYTAYSLAMMAQFGRDAWRAHGEVFSVWFGLLGRLAAVTLAEGGRLRTRGFGLGLLEPGWAISDVVLVGLAAGAILFDGLSQTKVWVDTFGLPAAPVQTLLLVVFLGIVVGAALVVARLVGVAATGAGLLPIAVGYLLAHYLTYLLIEGQRIVIAISDPLQRGWDLFGTAFWQPTGAFLPPALVWTVQLAAVVGGHMLGAWGGHVVAGARLAAEAPQRTGGPAVRVAAAGARAGLETRDLRLRQVPLAVVMVGLTTLTLWSLGQALFIAPPA